MTRSYFKAFWVLHSTEKSVAHHFIVKSRKSSLSETMHCVQLSVKHSLCPVCYVWSQSALEQLWLIDHLRMEVKELLVDHSFPLVVKVPLSFIIGFSWLL